MYLSNPAKPFLLSIILLLLATGCSLVGRSGVSPAAAVEEPAGRVPFKTKEPETFQCEIIETAGGVARRKRLAKKGTWRRIDFDPGEMSHRTLLQAGKEYIIDPGRRIYAETEPAGGTGFDELTHELIGGGRPNIYEESGRDGTIVTYTARSADEGAGVTVVRFDEAIGLPVGQEFYSIENGEQVLRFKVEMENFKLEPDADAFVVPGGFDEVSVNEFLNAKAK